MATVVSFIFVILLVFPNFCTSTTLTSTTTTSSPSFTCDYDALCNGLSEASYAVDPYDCHSFYHCIGDPLHVSDKLTCSQGTYFNSTTNTCVEEITPCTPNCDNFECKKDCDLDSVLKYIPDPNDCSSYYECGPSDPVQRQCPSEASYFNGRECDTQVEECCSGLCSPYCSEGDLYDEVEDPYDCRAYYYCMNVGIPEFSDGYGSCPGGEYFNADQHECIEGDTCDSYCTLQ